MAELHESTILSIYVEGAPGVAEFQSLF